MKSGESTPLIKICGTTSSRDALLAEQAGADYLGIVVEHPPSPRSVSLDEAALIAQAVSLPVVAVTVNLPLSRLLEIERVLSPEAIQLHGDEPPELIRALRNQGARIWGAAGECGESLRQRADALSSAGVDAIVVDARATDEAGTVYGGTGHISDWDVARELVQNQRRVVLAGGLSPANVANAIATVRPWMVDVVSGVEAEKGRKGEAKVRAFVEAARRVEIGGD